MKPVLVLGLLLTATASAVTPVSAQPTAFCPYGQTCQKNVPPVPFPVINPVQGLSNVLTLPQRNTTPPPPPAVGYAPIATPPPVLPSGVNR
ncbi:MAG TPA: hypothetical protein VH189_02945 [Rhizomicrobium sp.]|nr:hypothetical protein [Rhizomicrobium sp.]